MPLVSPDRRASLVCPETQDSPEVTDGPESLDPQALKETQASQGSQEDQAVPELKEPWERWASQVLRDRKEPLVCPVALEDPELPDHLVSPELKVNPDQLESDPQEYKDLREMQDSQVSQGPQDRKELQDHPVCPVSLEVVGPRETPVCQDSKVLLVSLVPKVWMVLRAAQD